MKSLLILLAIAACALGSAPQLRKGVPKFPVNQFRARPDVAHFKKGVPKFTVSQFMTRQGKTYFKKGIPKFAVAQFLTHKVSNQLIKGPPKFPNNQFLNRVRPNVAQLRKGVPRFPVHRFLNRVNSKIINGNFSEQHEFPFTVSIQRRGALTSWSHSCGGSIIASTWVLTNAACLDGIANLANARVYAGENNLVNSTGFDQMRNVTKWIQHPDFNLDLYQNDVALIEVNVPFDFSTAAVKPVALPSVQDQEYASGTPVTVAGWGSLINGGFNVNNQHKADVFVRSDDECRTTYGNSTIKDSMLCAGLPEGGTDPCGGDYGGPLFTNDNGSFEQVGIASWDQQCGSAIYPAVYTQVSYFIDWIQSQMNGNSTSI